MNHPASHEAVQAILNRRSIRRFLDRPVSNDVIRDVLRIAARAPSGTNIGIPDEQILLSGMAIGYEDSRRMRTN
ncbi:nitroreductase family protein [Cupriavidus necator]